MFEIVLDTETTGISVKEGHRIVEIGCIELKNQVDFFIVYPSWFQGTNLRKEAFSGLGKAVGNGHKKHTKNTMTADQCARDIVGAMHNRKKELWFPAYFRWIYFLKWISPRLLEWFIRKKIKGTGGKNNLETRNSYIQI